MKTVQIIVVVALLSCLLPMPYGYYILIRFFVTIVFAIMAYNYYRQQSNAAVVLFGCLALLFQPFCKIALGRVVWNTVDVAVAILFIVLLYKGRNASNKEKAIEGNDNKKALQKGDEKEGAPQK